MVGSVLLGAVVEFLGLLSGETALDSKAKEVSKVFFLGKGIFVGGNGVFVFSIVLRCFSFPGLPENDKSKS